MNTLIPSHTACNGCPHAADEHSASGACLSYAGNGVTRCACLGFARDLPDRLLGIADESDIVATVPASHLAAALRIAFVQADECHDDEWEGYGESVDREALVAYLRSLLDALRNLEAHEDTEPDGVIVNAFGRKFQP